MKLNYQISIAVIASLAVILPMSAFAKDDKQDEKTQGAKAAGGSQRGGKAAPQRMSQPSAPSGGKSRANNVRGGGGSNKVSSSQPRINQAAAVRRSNVPPAAPQRLQSTAAAPSGGKFHGNAVRNTGGASAVSTGRARGGRALSQPAVVQQPGVATSPGVSAVSSGRGHGNRALSQPAVVQQPGVVTSSGGRVHRNNVNNGTAAFQQPNVSRVGSRRLQSGAQGAQTQIIYNQQYNKTNNYGGLWFAGDSHSDWNRDGEHNWNNHNYRWFDGGWLIIDGGYTPSYYSNSGSTVSDVQSTLSDQGYYHGEIDGDMGPGTRHAIANYQGDHDLRVTGRINEPLLESLQLN